MVFNLSTTTDGNLHFKASRVKFECKGYHFNADKKSDEFINCDLSGYRVPREVLTDEDCFKKYLDCLTELGELETLDREDFIKIEGTILGGISDQRSIGFHAIKEDGVKVAIEIERITKSDRLIRDLKRDFINANLEITYKP